MRGLMMALFALDFPGNNGALDANRWAGRIGVPDLLILTGDLAFSGKVQSLLHRHCAEANSGGERFRAPDDRRSL
mgnify:CR=1 FL=1